MTNRQILAVLAGLSSLALGVFAVRLFTLQPFALGPDAPEPATTAARREGQLSGPYTYKNLSVYLIHGENAQNGKTPLTLEEAMSRKQVVVHETEDVNELAIENVSQKDEVYVQAGDIVKGGKQDRFLAVDLIVPAMSGRLPIDSFCVEHGRWTARGSESSMQFESSTNYAPSKDMKLAAKSTRSQTEVWTRVAESQSKLSAATNTNTASSVSNSSLPLTLENSRVRSDSAEYVDALADIVESKPDVIGFLFAINGEINSADTYGSGDLFIKLWPKLLKAAAIEAVAESDHAAPPEANVPKLQMTAIESFFEFAESAAITDKRQITDRILMLTRETKTSALFESHDRGTLLHRNYIMK
ncbi:MAG: DUF6569 family protein [Acidobacteriota bacterium]